MGRVDAGDLLERARAEFAPDPRANRVVPLVESGRAAPALLRALAAEERAVVAADRRAFLRLAERAAAMPRCAAYYAELARGEEEAAIRLDAFARAVDALPDARGGDAGPARARAAGGVGPAGRAARTGAGDVGPSAPAARPGTAAGTGAGPEGRPGEGRGTDGGGPGSGSAPGGRGLAGREPGSRESAGRASGGPGPDGPGPVGSAAAGQESAGPGSGGQESAGPRSGGQESAGQASAGQASAGQRYGGRWGGVQDTGGEGAVRRPGAPVGEPYELRAGCQAYPAFVAWLALNAAPAGTVLALAANFSAWGGYCSRIARGLREHYGLDDAACGFFDLFAEPAPAYEETVVAAVREWADAGRIDEAAVRRHGRLLRSYEAGFWDALLGS